MPMLRFDSSFTPLSSPATIEPIATTVSTLRMQTCTTVPSPVPKSASSPAAIWLEPSPSETATPKSVPSMEAMSMALPTGPWIPSRSSG